MKRLITEKQERILKLVHHEFDGLSQTEAAKKLGVSQSTISDTLKQIEKVMPQYFPILTKLEAKCYHYYMIEGWSVGETAEYMNHTQDAVYKALQRAKDKGVYFTEARGKVLSYDESMDANVKQKF